MPTNLNLRRVKSRASIHAWAREDREIVKTWIERRPTENRFVQMQQRANGQVEESLVKITPLSMWGKGDFDMQGILSQWRG